MTENGKNYVRNKDLTVEVIRSEFLELTQAGYQEVQVPGYVFFIVDREGGRHGFKSLVSARRYIGREKLNFFAYNLKHSPPL